MAEKEQATTKRSNIQPAGPKGDGPDSDQDGMSDDYETSVWGSDPNVADSDGDGLSDLAEWWIDTDPRKKDTDGDGWEDGEDLAFGDPLRQNPGGQERAEFLKRTREAFDKQGSDRDGDYVRDYLEDQEGTSKQLRDTDNDGLDDRIELQLRGQGVDVDPTGDPGDRSDLDAARERLGERREVTDALPGNDQSSFSKPVADEGAVASYEAEIVDPGMESFNSFSPAETATLDQPAEIPEMVAVSDQPVEASDDYTV
jgi:hypothetical protein